MFKQVGQNRQSVRGFDQNEVRRNEAGVQFPQSNGSPVSVTNVNAPPCNGSLTTLVATAVVSPVAFVRPRVGYFVPPACSA